MAKTNDDIRGFSMDAGEITAFVYAHMGFTDDADKMIAKLLSFDRLSLGRYTLIKFGDAPEMTAEERAMAVKDGKEFYDLYEFVDRQKFDFDDLEVKETAG